MGAEAQTSIMAATAVATVESPSGEFEKLQAPTSLPKERADERVELNLGKIDSYILDLTEQLAASDSPADQLIYSRRIDALVEERIVLERFGYQEIEAREIFSALAAAGFLDVEEEGEPLAKETRVDLLQKLRGNLSPTAATTLISYLELGIISEDIERQALVDVCRATQHPGVDRWIFNEGLHSSHATVRHACAEILLESADKLTHETVLMALQTESNATVARACAKVIQGTPYESVTRELCDYLNELEEAGDHAIAAAIEGLRNTRHALGREYLLSLCEPPYPQYTPVLQEACKVLTTIADQRVERALSGVIRSSDPQLSLYGVQSTALQTLEYIKPRKATNEIGRILKNPENATLTMTAISLLKDRPTALFTPLVRALLSHKEVMVQKAAAEFFGRFPDKRASKLMVEMIDGSEDNAAVLMSVADALTSTEHREWAIDRFKERS